MCVYARFFGSKSTAEASTEEATADTLMAEPAAEGGSEAEALKDAADDATGDKAAAAETASAEGVEIPKQQSAEEAADNEAGEGARK